MKNFLIFILFSSIFLSSCSIDWNDDKDKKITEPDQKINTFEKKLECYKLENKITEQMFQKYGDKNIAIKEIFYSPKIESCIYISTATITNGTDNSEINDFLSKETLMKCYEADCQNKFNEKIKELKGE